MTQTKLRSSSTGSESAERLRDRLADQFPELHITQIQKIIDANVDASLPAQSTQADHSGNPHEPTEPHSTTPRHRA